MATDAPPPASGPRSRKRGRTQQRPVAAPAGSRAARTEAKNAAVRATLVPYAPGERPPALVVAVVLCVVLAAANVGLYAAGQTVQGQKPQVTGVLAFAGVLGLAAAGMWAKRYWAVLGFQALLAITIAVAALSVLVASNVAAVALCLTIIGLGGWLFWKLVRVLGRLAAPGRPDAAAGRQDAASR